MGGNSTNTSRDFKGRNMRIKNDLTTISTVLPAIDRSRIKCVMTEGTCGTNEQKLPSMTKDSLYARGIKLSFRGNLEDDTFRDLDRAFELLNKNGLDAAEKIYDKIIDNMENNPEAQKLDEITRTMFTANGHTGKGSICLQRGYTHMKEGKTAIAHACMETANNCYFKAREVMEKADVFKGEYAGVILLNLGQSYWALEKDDEALECYGKILTEHEKYGFDVKSRQLQEALIRTGDIYHKQKNYPLAAECYKQAEEILIHRGEKSPLINLVFCHLAQKYEEQGNIKEALRLHREIVNNLKGTTDEEFRPVLEYSERALAEYHISPERTPVLTNGQDLLGKALTYLEYNEADEAEKISSTILETWPDNEILKHQTHILRSDIYIKKGDYQKARGEAEKVVKHFGPKPIPKNPVIIDLMANAYSNLSTCAMLTKGADFTKACEAERDFLKWMKSHKIK